MDYVVVHPGGLHLALLVHVPSGATFPWCQDSASTVAFLHFPLFVHDR